MVHIKRLVMHGFKSFARKTEIPFENSMNVIVGPNGSGKSCHYDTEVKLSNGEDIKIGKLVEEQLKNSQDVLTLKDGIYTKGKDIQIISLNKFTGKQEIKKISNFIKREGEEIYEIKTASGKSVKATGCHPVMTFKDGQIKSVLIRELQEDSLIATPRTIQIVPDKQYPKNLARLMGYLIGDGYLAKDRIEFVNQDQEIIEDYKNILNQYFKVNLKIRKDKNATRIYFRNKNTVKQIKDFFIKNHKGSITSEIKKIPNLLLRTNNEVIAQTLAGLYDTDGSIRKDIAVIEFCSKNNNLTKQMQDLLLRFDITSKIKIRSCCATNTENKTKRDYSYLYIYGKDNLQKFHNNIPLKISYKQEIIKNHLNQEITPNPNLDILPKEINEKIRSITELLGINAKPLRKKYPFYMAYLEDRCHPTAIGIKKLLPILETKYEKLLYLYHSISPDPNNLIIRMDELNISGIQTSKEIGVCQALINRDWRTNTFTANPTNLQNFYTFIKTTLENRLLKIELSLSTLKMMVNSDIYWDKIISIEKLPKEEYVYDLSVKDNHNFLANGLFVHNSNITDALCFVLGRLSIKSIRAAKAANLLFSGNKLYKSSQEASVELIFDNEDKTFAIEKNEVSIKRVVRKNGQSVYKINGETKTRQELLELLAQAGIDPNGFNIILQGEIASLIKSTPEDRRKIIEEVAGISIYETRKHKSLRELEKTEEKLKEISAILRERNAYLRTIDKERQDALNYQKLEETIRRCKATILDKNLKDKERDISNLDKEIETQNKEIEKIRKHISEKNSLIENLQEKMSNINKQIQSSTGDEQEVIHKELSDVKAEIAGLEVRKENFENRIQELQERMYNSREKKKQLESDINQIKTSSPEIKKQQSQQKEIQEKFDLIEKQRRRFYILKSEIATLENQKEQKQTNVIESEKELQIIERNISSLFGEIKYAKSIQSAIELKNNTKNEIEETKNNIEKIHQSQIEREKRNAILEQDIKREEKLKEDITKLDICPLCKSKVTKEHITEVLEKSKSKIGAAKNEIEKNIAIKDKLSNDLSNNQQKLQTLELKLNEIEIDIMKLKNSEEKKEQIKKLVLQKESSKDDIKTTNEKLSNLREEFDKLKNIEEKYDETRVQLQELSLVDIDIDSETSMKQRELNRLSIELKAASRDLEESENELKKINSILSEKLKIAEKKELEEQKLYEKGEKLFGERNELQDRQKAIETDIIGLQHQTRTHEDKINNIKIQKAQFNAQLDSLKTEFNEITSGSVGGGGSLGVGGKLELIQAPIEIIKERLQKSQFRITQLGNVNLRSLEVYDRIKEQCDQIEEKVQTIESEKGKIAQIIEEIDKKKKKSFMRTLEAVNQYFTRNFVQLSRKGEVFLELENPKDPFSAGLNIIIKVGRGKYFDITSLSGGEKTLVALSLIFAIQEYKPYCFYIFDEIDAALDKHNSELLAALIKKYMISGQYIVITHNDALISEATTLYGVSMQENLSKVISLKI